MQRCINIQRPFVAANFDSPRIREGRLLYVWGITPRSNYWFRVSGRRRRGTEAARRLGGGRSHACSSGGQANRRLVAASSSSSSRSSGSGGVIGSEDVGLIGLASPETQRRRLIERGWRCACFLRRACDLRLGSVLEGASRLPFTAAAAIV